MNQSATNNSLCKECSLLDYDQIQEDRYVLKPSWAALVKSGEDGCRFCSLIVHYTEYTLSQMRGGIDENEGEDHVICRRGFEIVQRPTKRNPKRLLSCLEPLSAANDPLPHLGRSRPLAQEVNSKDCYDFITSWLQSCHMEHPECARLQEPRPMPARLINVLPNGKTEDLRLEETEGRLGEWLTLSHCWGGTSPLKTTLKTLQSRCDGIPWKDLPLTFQDAVTVTRRLGFQYLWIDSLCILQDSQEDWRTHSAIMGQIYRNSALCIVAEMSANSDAGIFNPANVVRRENHIVVPYLSGSLRVRGEVCFRYPVRGDMYEWGGPLSRRAWTLQESAMADRIVRYGKEQIYLRCPMGRIAEASPKRLDRTDTLGFDRDHRRILKLMRVVRKTKPLRDTETSSTDESLVECENADTIKGSTEFEECSASEESETEFSSGSAQNSEAEEPFQLSATTKDIKHKLITTSERLESWYRMIDDFARRRLTYETDRLPAIAGVATEVQTLLRYRYVCGLWLEDIHWGLLWRARGRAILPQQYVAPSWSWASISVKPSKTRDEYDKYERHDFPIYGRTAQERISQKTLEATILQVDAKNVVDDNPFLQVMSGFLTMRNYCQLLSDLIVIARDFDESVGAEDFDADSSADHSDQDSSADCFDEDFSGKNSDKSIVLKCHSEKVADVRSKRRILLDFDSTAHWEAPPFGAEQGIMLLLIAQWTVKHRPEYFWIEQPDWTENISYALILEPTGDTRYRRIGIAEFPEVLFRLEKWDMREMVII